MTSESPARRHTPLYAVHRRDEARMVPFAGWEMPVQYDGIVAEHLHTRNYASLFDVCHMGEVFVRGPDAVREAGELITRRVDSLRQGRSRYALMLNDQGGILDDLIVFRTGPDEVMLVVNAATRHKDLAWIRARTGRDTTVEDRSDEMAKIDVQGPRSAPVVENTLHTSLSEVKRFAFKDVDWCGNRVIVSRTGYTGEDGFELFLPPEAAEELWDALLDHSEVRPAGLGARDTLRLEKGLTLYGHDIDETHTPLDAGLDRFVDFEHTFIGRERLIHQKERGVQQRLTGFVCDGRRAAREHFSVQVNGETVGTVTSGAYSPCMKRAIGFCYVRTELAQEGQRVQLTDGRRITLDATLCQPPVYRPGVNT